MYRYAVMNFSIPSTNNLNITLVDKKHNISNTPTSNLIKEEDTENEDEEDDEEREIQRLIHESQSRFDVTCHNIFLRSNLIKISPNRSPEQKRRRRFIKKNNREIFSNIIDKKSDKLQYSSDEEFYVHNALASLRKSHSVVAEMMREACGTNSMSTDTALHGEYGEKNVREMQYSPTMSKNIDLMKTLFSSNQMNKTDNNLRRNLRVHTNDIERIGINDILLNKEKFSKLLCNEMKVNYNNPTHKEFENIYYKDKMALRFNSTENDNNSTDSSFYEGGKCSTGSICSSRESVTASTQCWSAPPFYENDNEKEEDLSNIDGNDDEQNQLNSENSKNSGIKNNGENYKNEYDYDFNYVNSDQQALPHIGKKKFKPRKMIDEKLKFIVNDSNYKTNLKQNLNWSAPENLDDSKFGQNDLSQCDKSYENEKLNIKDETNIKFMRKSKTVNFEKNELDQKNDGTNINYFLQEKLMKSMRADRYDDSNESYQNILYESQTKIESNDKIATISAEKKKINSYLIHQLDGESKINSNNNSRILETELLSNPTRLIHNANVVNKKLNTVFSAIGSCRLEVMLGSEQEKLTEMSIEPVYYINWPNNTIETDFSQSNHNLESNYSYKIEKEDKNNPTIAKNQKISRDNNVLSSDYADCIFNNVLENSRNEKIDGMHGKDYDIDAYNNNSGDLGLAWLKRSCFSLNDANLLDFPMADEEASSLTTSYLFSRKSLNSIYMANINPIDFESLIVERRLADGSRSPPFALADALSESELSELEIRVARGDFAVTDSDLVPHHPIEYGNDNISKMECENNMILTDEIDKHFVGNENLSKNKIFTKQDDAKELFGHKDDKIQNNEQIRITNDLISKRTYDYDFWLDPNARSSSMPSLKLAETDIYLLKSSHINYENAGAKVSKTSYSRNPDFIRNHDFGFEEQNKNSEILTHMMMTRSFTTETANQFTTTPNGPRKQRRILPLRPDERWHTEDTYYRQPYQQRILSPLQSQCCLPIVAEVSKERDSVFAQQPKREYSKNYFPALQLEQQENNHLITKRRLPELPKYAESSAENSILLETNQSNECNENNSENLKIQEEKNSLDKEDLDVLIEPQQLINILKSDNLNKIMSYGTSLPSTSSRGYYYSSLYGRNNMHREEYQLLYSMDARSSNDYVNDSTPDEDNYPGPVKDEDYSTNVTHQKTYGILDGSYYEDDAIKDNCSLQHLQPNEGETRVILNTDYSYNMLDGENSSGISSCCTSSSTVGGAPVHQTVCTVACNEAPLTSRIYSRQSHKSGQQTKKNNRKNIQNRRPTHRVQFPFVPRHSDEINLEIGDAINVERLGEDHWCYGINLRTSQSGIFPLAHVCEIDLIDEICQNALSTNVATNFNVVHKQERDTFYLTMLASVEVAHHKGNDVLVQAINKVCSIYQQKDEILVPQTVLMEISFRGIHVIDKQKKDFFRCPTFDFFYSLQNISFCGAHPKQLRYFGFITKHPLLPRFACHVFLSQESTQSIVESIGRAFKRSYDEYMAFAHPTEDIFIE